MLMEGDVGTQHRSLSERSETKRNSGRPAQSLSPELGLALLLERRETLAIVCGGAQRLLAAGLLRDGIPQAGVPQAGDQALRGGERGRRSGRRHGSTLAREGEELVGRHGAAEQ